MNGFCLRVSLSMTFLCAYLLGGRWGSTVLLVVVTTVACGVSVVSVAWFESRLDRMRHERDAANAAVGQVLVWGRGLVATADQVVEASQDILKTRNGYLVGDVPTMESLVAEARSRGANVEYVSIDDLESA